MRKGKNALNFLFILLMSSGLMMATSPLSSPTERSFNESLRTSGGEGTKVTLNELSKVVIDAGHGGKDPGGMGDNSYEKHIALSIARLLAIGIRTNYPDVEVIMTRSDDTFIPLYERAQIANEAGADLFISIHANIMPGSKATYGTETFVMGQHVAAQNLEVAKRENASILLETGDVTANYGYDPNSPEGHILMSMQQHAFLERSILFAEAVERQFSVSGRKSRGVKQAGFVVLKATTMPAVLVETGFMSNLNEETFLLSDAGQQQLATALLMAFGEYYTTVNDVRVVQAPSRQRTVPSATSPANTQPVSPQPVITQQPKALPPRAAGFTAPPTTPSNVLAKEVSTALGAPAPQWTAKGGASVVYQPVAREETSAPAYAVVAPRTYRPITTAPSPSVLRKEVAPAGLNTRVVPGPAPPSYSTGYSYPKVAVDSTTPSGFKFPDARKRETPLPAGQIDLRKIPDSQLTYGVQVFATKRDLDLTQLPWRAVPYPIIKVREGGLNKYQVRNLPTAAAASEAKQRIKAAGVSESMIVAYLGGKRLPAGAVNYLLAR